MMCSLLGCENSAPQLRYVRIGIAETEVPPILGVEVSNDGAAPANVNGCNVEVLSAFMFQVDDSTIQWPEKFEYHTELLRTPSSNVIPPGERKKLPLAFIWDFPAQSPNLIAVCKAKFSVSYDAAIDVETEPVMFLVGSSATAKQLVADASFDDLSNAVELLHQMDAFQGKKSGGVQQFVEKLREFVGQ